MYLMDAKLPQKHVPSITGRVWLASRLLNRQVVNAATLEPVGRIKDVVFDPKSCQVVALSIHSAPLIEEGWMASIRRVLGRSRSVGYVTLNHILSLSGDVIVVDTAPGRATSLHVDRMPHLCEVCELAIITLHGVCLGAFADVLVDNKGSRVVGYVVNPAAQAEELMVPFDEIELAPPPFADRAAAATSNTSAGEANAAPVAENTEVGAASTQPAEVVSLSHLRVIPASSRVRIGDSLIMVFEDVEPLRHEGVVIAPQAQVDTQSSQTQVEAPALLSPLRQTTS